MLNCVLVGLTLVAVTVGLHAAGTSWWIGRLNTIAAAHDGSPHRFPTQFRVLGATAMSLVLLHTAEVVLWSLVYLVLGIDSLSSFEESTYFSMVTYSALGYGDVVITGPWRLLAAIQAMTGLLLFGWSAALLYAVVQGLGQGRRVDTIQEE